MGGRGLRRPAIMSVTARSNSSSTMRSFQQTTARATHTGTYVVPAARAC